MTGMLAVFGAVYGSSALILIGSGVAWVCSQRFRRSLIGDITKY